MRPVASSRVRGAGGGSRAIVTNSSLRCESVLPSKRRARREDSRPTSFRRDHVVGVAVGGRKRLEEGLREVRRADVERGARWPGLIGRPRPRGAAENGERLGGAEQAC